MKRCIYILPALILLVCCGSPQKQTNTLDIDLVFPAQSAFTKDYNSIFFGKIGYRDRTFQQDTLKFPPIESLVHESVFTMCPTDTCFAEYAVLALRCPPIQPLLDWVADTVHTFANECPIGDGLQTYNDKEHDIPKKHLKSDQEICNYYVGQLQHVYDKWHCTGEGDHDNINEQAGLLIADCWNSGNLFTFFRIDWYDWMSGGNNVRESWWTVDSTTGKLLTLEDLIQPEKLDTLSTLMMRRLADAEGKLLLRTNSNYALEDKDVIGLADGCALIPEGLIIFFYPYNLGSGAEGEFLSVIPYEELNGILREPLSMVLAPLSQEEDIDPRDFRRKDGRPHIDLFGVELVGTPKRILHELSGNKFINIDLGPEGFYNETGNKVICRAFIGGIPFGMNLTFGEDEEAGLVKDVLFANSETDWTVMANLIKILSDYYGQPESIDYYEKRYNWNSKGHSIIARPLHSKDSGWTFFIN